MGISSPGRLIRINVFGEYDPSHIAILRNSFPQIPENFRIFIAPQAPLEESATTEASRRCSLNGMLTGIRRPFWRQVFEASASGIWLLAVQNKVPEMLSIGPILSVGLCVCSTFSAALFGPILDRIHSYFQKKKITQKRELEPNSVGEADHFHATLPRSLHSPQVATAAPPSPLGPIGGVAVEICT